MRRDGSLQPLEGLISKSQTRMNQCDLESDDVCRPRGLLEVMEKLPSPLRAAGDGVGVAQEALSQRE